MFKGIQERLALWGIVEPMTRVRFASDGATVCVSADEMRVIEGSRNSTSAPVALYQVSVEGGTARLTLTRGLDTPIELAQYPGRSGYRAARKALRDLATEREGADRPRGFSWLKTIAAVGVLWMGVHFLRGVPSSSTALRVSTPSVGPTSISGAQAAPSSPLILPALPTGGVTCGDLK